MFEIKSLKRTEVIVEVVRGGLVTSVRLQGRGKALSDFITPDMKTQKDFGYLDYKVHE